MLLTAAVTVSAAVARADKAPTYAAAIGTVIKNKKLSTTVMHRQVRYLNDVIEGDHGRLKPILGLKGGGFKNGDLSGGTVDGDGVVGVAVGNSVLRGLPSISVTGWRRERERRPEFCQRGGKETISLLRLPN